MRDWGEGEKKIKASISFATPELKERGSALKKKEILVVTYVARLLHSLLFILFLKGKILELSDVSSMSVWCKSISTISGMASHCDFSSYMIF